MQEIESHKKERLTELNRKKSSNWCRGFCSSLKMPSMDTGTQLKRKGAKPGGSSNDTTASGSSGPVLKGRTSIKS